MTETDPRLPVNILDAKAPGILDLFFGTDGSFDSAPRFTGPVWSKRLCCYVHVGPEYAPKTFQGVRNNCSGLPMLELDDLAIDFRVITVASRAAFFCQPFVVADSVEYHLVHFFLAYPGGYTPSQLVDLTNLFVTLAPQIVTSDWF